MAFRVNDCLDAIQHELGGRLSKNLSPVSLINEAGEYVSSMHGWQWQRRPATTLDFVGGQGYVELPTDFGRILSLQYTDSLTNIAKPTTLDDLQIKRTSWNSGITDLYYALSYYLPSTGIPRQRLEIWPTPDVDSAGVLTLVYSVGWVDVSKDVDPIPVPAWLRPLFLQVVRCFAARDAADPGSGAIQVEQALTSIDSGTIYENAKKRDRANQPVLGVIGETKFTSIQWDNGRVLDPS